MRRNSFLIWFFLIFSIVITGCASETEELEPIDQTPAGIEVNQQMSWHEDFSLKLKDKRIEPVNHITIQTEKPNTVGFRLILLSFEQLAGIKWPTTYIIPFSTDESGNALIELDYLFPGKQQDQIKLVDYKIDHPILFSAGTRSFTLISDGSYEFRQTDWFSPYQDLEWNWSELEAKGDTWG